MLKRRLIFTFLVENGRFVLSRNFSLQAAGDLQWVRDHYEFDAIAFSIDELVILDVTRGPRDHAAFAALLEAMGERCFMPIAAGGGVRSMEDARRLLRSGADKIVVNTPLFTDPALVRALVGQFGSQCVVASIDYKRAGTEGLVYVENGSRNTGLTVAQAVARAEELEVGELYLTSMALDGTGQGFDTAFIAPLAEAASIPVIISGGAGQFSHLSKAIQAENIAAVSTANLFNFMGDSLTDAREHMIAQGVQLATWNKLSRPAHDE